jgi:DNA-binding MurR/RpiR family transcriptional regulator
MNKFFRFNVPVIYSDDIVLQRMSCMNCDDDVVVIISHTGSTKSLVELAQLARENDAMVIALTSAGTPPGKRRSPLPWMCRKIPTSICRWSPSGAADRH